MWRSPCCSPRAWCGRHPKTEASGHGTAARDRAFFRGPERQRSERQRPEHFAPPRAFADPSGGGGVGARGWAGVPLASRRNGRVSRGQSVHGFLTGGAGGRSAPAWGVAGGCLPCTVFRRLKSGSAGLRPVDGLRRPVIRLRVVDCWSKARAHPHPPGAEASGL